MHILHLSAVNNWGGGEHHIENLCQELSISHPEVKNTIYCVKNGAFHKRLKQKNIPFIVAPLFLKVDPRYFLKLGRFCKKHSVDLIHIHDPSAILLAILADKFYNLPPFIFSKKTSFPIKQRKKTLYKYNYHKIEKILCVSKETQRVASAGIEDRNKLITIYHGTNLETKSSKTPFLLREKYRIPDNMTIVGNIANHIRAKHLDTLVDVANTIVYKSQRKDVVFIQIGNFTDRTEALKERVQKLKLEKNVLFLGYLPNASNFLPQFDISLITSQSEGIPQVIYESFYHKIPVISTNVGGIPEIVDHNVNGLLAPMHDFQKLSEHILNLSGDSEKQERFTKLGYEKLIQKFTTKNMAAQTFQIYKQLL